MPSTMLGPRARARASCYATCCLLVAGQIGYYLHMYFVEGPVLKIDHVYDDRTKVEFVVAKRCAYSGQFTACLSTIVSSLPILYRHNYAVSLQCCTPTLQIKFITSN